MKSTDIFTVLTSLNLEYYVYQFRWPLISFINFSSFSGYRYSFYFLCDLCALAFHPTVTTAKGLVFTFISSLYHFINRCHGLLLFWDLVSCKQTVLPVSLVGLVFFFFLFVSLVLFGFSFFIFFLFCFLFFYISWETSGFSL